MNIELKDILNVLTLYDINANVVDFLFFENTFDEEESEAKFILRANLSDDKSLVIRFIRQEEYPRNKTEKQSVFAEHLRERGVFTPKKYKSGDVFCTVYQINGLDFDVTVEDYIGKAGNFLTDINSMYKIGQLTGKMHHISEKDNLHINADTLYNLMGYNEFNGYNMFKWYGNNGFIKNDIFSGICSIYEKKINWIKLIWDTLPKYAVQGDTCTYNLTYDSSELGIFDYNNAGDGTLIYDMIIHGFYSAYHSHNYVSENLTENEKLNLFNSYYDGYISQRPFSENEKSVYDDIFSVTKGMHHLRINVAEDSLGKLIEKKEQEKIDVLLQKIYQDINCDSFRY